MFLDLGAAVEANVLEHGAGVTSRVEVGQMRRVGGRTNGGAVAPPDCAQWLGNGLAGRTHGGTLDHIVGVIEVADQRDLVAIPLEQNEVGRRPGNVLWPI